MDMNTAQPLNSDPYFLEIPFPKRWECHKDTIKRLYIDNKKTVEEVAETMKISYMFDADARQYKHHLKQWGITKNVSSSIKDKAIKAMGKRARDGSVVAGVRHEGSELDKKRLRRYMSTQAKLEQDLQINNNVFTHWNLPSRAFRASHANETSVSSPFAVSSSTPSDISVFSPSHAIDGPSPRNASSPINTPTPMTLAVRAKMYNDRARYLIQGMHDEFLKDMPHHEKRIATTWLYQFWLFSFKTVKHWGKGPLHWSSDLLGFAEFQDVNTLPNTPAAVVGTPGTHGLLDSIVHEGRDSGQDPTRPPSLCRWSIHCNNDIQYAGITSPPTEPQENLDLNDPDSWPTWTGNVDHVDLVERLQEALRSNSFSNIEVKDLPLSTTQIVKAAERSPGELLKEAVSFAIMARNEDFLWNVLAENSTANLDLTWAFPFHLATSYIDGAKTCCNIVNLTMHFLAGRNLIKNLYVNDLGHTVLDNLMISILKAHTSCVPATVDNRLRKSKRFAGEEVDICGRWDADSPCIRALLANGDPTIPFSWKHMFCHTSAQAIYHSIAMIFTPIQAPNINNPSGLFTKICGNCNYKLQLQPLHCLVLTGFYLAQSGCKGENLFGILACLVCLLVHGADPLQKAEISIKALLGNDDGECSHSLIDPVELADQVPAFFITAWTDEVKLGWEVFRCVLRFAQRERSQVQEQYRPEATFADFDYMDEEIFIGEEASRDVGLRGDGDEDDCGWCTHRPEHSNFYGGSTVLGTLWAAIQTELLTYRRLKEGDSWISDYFSMGSLLDGLNGGFGCSFLPLVEREMMKPFCKCGRFSEVLDESCARVTEASAFYFSNLEDWDRSCFIAMPDASYA